MNRTAYPTFSERDRDDASSVLLRKKYIDPRNMTIAHVTHMKKMCNARGGGYNDVFYTIQER